MKSREPSNLIIRKRTLLALAVILAAIAILVVQLLRPVPGLRLEPTVQKVLAIPGTAPAIPWPEDGQATMALQGSGSFGSSGGEQPVAIGSVAKIMTAYVILKNHPMGIGETGPSVTMTEQDVAVYQADKADHQSVVKVQAGEQLTEMQMLEALLLPSGNNIATTLAVWDAGSLPAFVAKMNDAAKALGLQHTHYADASGDSPATTSTATDQTALALEAMKNPIFAQIVAMPQVTLPVQGIAYNVNALVGHDGVVGIKTGSTPQAGGCLVFAAQRKVSGQKVLLIGAVLGQQGVSVLETVLKNVRALIDTATPALTTQTLITAGQTVARVHVPWQSVPIEVKAPQAVSVVGWPGLAFDARVQAAPLGKTLQEGAPVGTLVITQGTREVAKLPLTAPSAVTGPGLRWKLTRF